MRRFLLISAVTVAFIAYRYGVWDLQVSTSLKVTFGVLRFIHDVCALGSMLGLGDTLLLERSVVNRLIPQVPITEGVSAKDVVLDGVPVRIYTARGTRDNAPGLVYFHGGGWMYGSVDLSNGFASEMAKDLKMVVVSVEYRLTPEHYFPEPFEDCVKAAMHLLKNAEKYGIDATRVAVAGESAGGNLAAAVALKLKDMKIQPALKAQVLLYPPLQALDFATPSYQTLETTLLLRKSMISFWLYYAQGHINNLQSAMSNEHVIAEVKNAMANSYIDHNILDKNMILPGYTKPRNIGGDARVWDELKPILMNPYLAPLVAEDLTGLPPVFLLVCEYDVLRDDSLMYIERLKSAGVEVQKHYAPDDMHGLLVFPSESPAKYDAQKAMYSFILTHL